MDEPLLDTEDGAGTDDVRDRLLEAAVDVFFERGYERSRVQDVAARAGVPIEEAHQRFKDKTALLAEALRARTEQVMRHVRADGPSPSLADVQESLARLFSLPPSRGDTLLLDALATLPDEPGQRVIDPVMRVTRRQLFGDLGSAQQRGDIDGALDLEALVSVFQALAVGTFVMRASGMAPLRTPDADAIAGRLLRCLGPES